MAYGGRALAGEDCLEGPAGVTMPCNGFRNPMELPGARPQVKASGRSDGASGADQTAQGEVL
jgi:hypothetical protein